MPLKKRHARIPAAVALVAVAAFAILWAAARTPFVRAMIEGEITDAAGLPASIESLRIGFWPSPTLHVGGLAIAQPTGFGDEPFLAVDRVELRIPWRSLFNVGRVETIAASDAVVRLVVGADGVPNWSKLGSGPAAGEGGAADPADFFVGKFALERGTVDYREMSAGSQWQLAAISIDASGVAPRTEFPLELKLGGVFGSNTIHYAMQGRGQFDPDARKYEGRGIEFRGWIGGEPLPLAGAELTGALGRAVYDGGAGVASLDAGRFNLAGIPGRFDGRLDVGEPSMTAVARVATEPFAPRAPAIIFGHPLPETTDPKAFESLQLAFEAKLADGALRLEPVSGRLDDTSFTGSAVPAERHLRAHLDRIDLNRYLPRAASPAPTQRKATLEALVGELEKLDVDAVIRIDQAQVAGAKMRDLVIRIEREGEAAP
jgi:hypothetical protein